MTLNSSATVAPTTAADRISRRAEAARLGIAGIPGIRWIRWRLDCRAGERAMWRLDDRMLRDIGLTRWDIHAAAYGRLTRAGPGAPEQPHRSRKPLASPQRALQTGHRAENFSVP